MMAAGRMLALKLRIETRIARMADPPPFTQTGKRLEIHTVLNDGTPLINALLLIWVKGSEEVSQPYTYQVKMWRLVNNTRPPISARRHDQHAGVDLYQFQANPQG